MEGNKDVRGVGVCCEKPVWGVLVWVLDGFDMGFRWFLHGGPWALRGFC